MSDMKREGDNVEREGRREGGEKVGHGNGGTQTKGIWKKHKCPIIYMYIGKGVVGATNTRA